MTSPQQRSIPSPADNVQAVINERIAAFEERGDLLRYKVGDWSVWTLLRFFVANRLLNIGLKSDSSKSNISKRIFIAAGSLPALLSLKKRKVLVKTYASARGETQGLQYKDVYFDDLLLQQEDFFKVEAINNFGMWERSRAALIPSNLYTPILDLSAVLLKKTLGLNRQSKRVALELSKLIHSEFSLDVSADLISDKIANFLGLKTVYGCLLDRIQPEVVLTADAGEYPLYAAARERGIRTMEFSHGICDRYCWAFSWTPYALPYRNNMPLPDRLLLYGRYMYDEFASRGFWGGALRSVGSLRLDEFRQRNSCKESDDDCVITFTTQGIQTEELTRFLFKFMEICRENHFQVKLYVKLHPFYDRFSQPYSKAFAQFGDSVVVVAAGDMPSTFELISRSHLHVSISSSCHYEALGLGVPTVVLPFATHEFVSNLLTANHGFLAESPQDLFDLAAQWKFYQVDESISHYYFEPHALENILREIGER